jgi:hypothetical protein
MSERLVKMLEQLQSDAVMSKFVTARECEAYRSAVEDMLVMLRACPSEAEQRKWVEVDKVPEWANEFASGQLTAYYPIRDEAGDDTGKYWAYTCPDVPDRSPSE